jgi:hypothetical protein
MEATTDVFNFGDPKLFSNILEYFLITTMTMLLSNLIVGNWRPITNAGKTAVKKMMRSTGYVLQSTPILVMPEEFFQGILKNQLEGLPRNFDEQVDFLKNYQGNLHSLKKNIVKYCIGQYRILDGSHRKEVLTEFNFKEASVLVVGLFSKKNEQMGREQLDILMQGCV